MEQCDQRRHLLLDVPVGHFLPRLPPLSLDLSILLYYLYYKCLVSDYVFILKEALNPTGGEWYILIILPFRGCM